MAEAAIVAPKAIGLPTDAAAATGTIMECNESTADMHGYGRRQELIGKNLFDLIAPEDRERMRQRIEQRFRVMLDAGFVDEVRTLLARGDPDADLPALRAVGYRQVRGFLAGELSYDEMVNQAIVATRQYAKRQLTWLRREENARWFAAEADTLLEDIAGYLEHCLKQ